MTQPPSSPPDLTEFDSYSADYNAGMDNSVKALMGSDADGFVAVKLRWLQRRLPELRGKGGDCRILDYGCGLAPLLRLMAEAGLAADLIGCDVSSGMLDAARRRWPEGLRRPVFHQQDGPHVPLPSASVDLVIISAVLHHVPQRDRAAVYAELRRVLRPEGRVVVFEHNPLNPVTRYVVARTPIDANAILLSANEVRTALREAQFTAIEVRYLMFLPPRLARFAALEGRIGWLPLGAQYAVTALRP
jgi:ubiquinone/menaquinone biosynthesis C-methylase UbiE